MIDKIRESLTQYVREAKRVLPMAVTAGLFLLAVLYWRPAQIENLTWRLVLVTSALALAYIGDKFLARRMPTITTLEANSPERIERIRGRYLLAAACVIGFCISF